MEVYVIETMGGQIVNGEYSKEICPKFLESVVKDNFNKLGYCFYQLSEYECIIYPNQESAEHAIEWALN